MSETERKGARNPKEVRLTFGITENINARLERLCDVAGMNKGSMSAAVLAAGLQALESAFLGITAETIAASARKMRESQLTDIREVEQLDNR